MGAASEMRAKLYDLCEGADFRRGPRKAALFEEALGRVLLVAVGTGIDIRHFPSGRDVVAIDISKAMLQRACKRQKCYCGSLSLVQTDALNLCFPDASFDTVVSSCTMCSVPEPRLALSELHRVLRAGGQLLMFEHVRSRNPILGFVLDAMTVISRRGGTEMNRDTLGNVLATGFRVTRVESVFLDIILSVRAMKPEMRNECIPRGIPSERRAL